MHTLLQSSTRFSSSDKKSSADKSTPTSSFPLGHPLPLDEHACSVSLPTWSSIVGYEEGSSEITSQLACGYPRFVFHPYVVELMDYAIQLDRQKQPNKSSISDIQQSSDCIILPNKDAAFRCHDYLIRACGYYDGSAKSPRISSSNRSLVGDVRIPLFFPDNALACSSASDDISQEVNSANYYHDKNPIRVLKLDSTTGIHAVLFPARTEFAIEAKSYWQHTGELVSSRMAEVALISLGIWSCNDDKSVSVDNKTTHRVTTKFFKPDTDKIDETTNTSHGWSICPYTKQPHIVLFPSSSEERVTKLTSGRNENESKHDNSHSYDPVNSYDGIINRIASITGVHSRNVFLTPSGMSSIYHSVRSARRRSLLYDGHDGGSSIVYGFPYLDTLKLCSRPELVPGGVKFFGYGDEQDLKHMQHVLQTSSSKFSILLTEYPSNPLLNCPDLHQLRKLADDYNFALVVDDTIGNFANLNLLESGLADAVCTSLTKLFNGRGDAIAGSIVTNPNTEIGRWMQDDLSKHHIHHEGLWKDDARAIFVNSENFYQRSSKINETAESLADWLRDRDEVETVYYPKYTCPEGYDSVKDVSTKNGEHKSGYGGLMSILLRPHVCQRTFYDQLDVSKGPSLGTNFTLVCPYTLLAHYHELDFAMSYNVQPNLLRIAVGLEDLEVLKNKFSVAFQRSKLHPRLPESVSNRGYCTGSFMLKSGSKAALSCNHRIMWKNRKNSIFPSYGQLNFSCIQPPHIKRRSSSLVSSITKGSIADNGGLDINRSYRLMRLLRRGVFL